MTLQQLNIFDYQQLDPPTRKTVSRLTDELHLLVKRTAEDICFIGQKLIEVKGLLGRGKFGDWLKHEFDWSHDTANRFMAVARRFQNTQIAEYAIAPSALYLLASSSVPDEVVEAVLERAAEGEKIGSAQVKETIAAAANPTFAEGDRVHYLISDPPAPGTVIKVLKDGRFEVQIDKEVPKFGGQILKLRADRLAMIPTAQVQEVGFAVGDRVVYAWGHDPHLLRTVGRSKVLILQMPGEDQETGQRFWVVKDEAGIGHGTIPEDDLAPAPAKNSQPKPQENLGFAIGDRVKFKSTDGVYQYGVIEQIGDPPGSAGLAIEGYHYLNTVMLEALGPVTLEDMEGEAAPTQTAETPADQDYNTLVTASVFDQEFKAALVRASLETLQAALKAAQENPKGNKFRKSELAGQIKKLMNPPSPQPQAQEFKVGDLVNVCIGMDPASPTSYKPGTVGDVRNGMPWVHLEGTDPDSGFFIEPKHLQLRQPAAAPALPSAPIEFEEGQVVEGQDQGGETRRGQIVGIGNKYLQLDTFPVLLTTAKLLEVSGPIYAFDVGDRVINPEGDVGTVAKIAQAVTSAVVYVRWDNSGFADVISPVFLAPEGSPPKVVSYAAELVEPEQALTPAEHSRMVMTSSNTDDHWTPKEVIDAVLKCFDEYIELDPCSNDGEPNVPAELAYCKDQDGLSCDWVADTLYMNPPYSEVKTWVQKLIHEIDQGHTKQAIALVKADTSTQWFKLLWENAQAVCFISHRLKFINEANQGNAATFASAVAYFGQDVDRFYHAFSPLGAVVQVIEPGMFGE